MRQVSCLHVFITLVRLHNSDATGAKITWPGGEIDENATRYIDFAVTAPAAAEVRITGISMDIAAHSTSTMCYHINTGFGDGFTQVQTIAEKVNMTNLAISHLAFTPTLTIPAGETLHVRVLPWHNYADAKSGKYIALRNVVISGQAFETTDVDPLTVNHSPLTVKSIRNGQLLITRDGKTYNALGQEIR